jgi:hypothetical protein
VQFGAEKHVHSAISTRCILQFENKIRFHVISNSQMQNFFKKTDFMLYLGKLDDSFF